MIYLHRITLSLLNAFVITSALLLIMYQLVKIEEPQLTARKSIQLPPLSNVKEDSDLRQKEHKPPKPKPIELPPEVIKEIEPIVLDIKNKDLDPIIIHHEPTKLVQPDNSQLILAIGFPPSYPNRLLSRGIEGYVVVGFSVDTAGAVFDPFIIESSPKGAFDKAALKAIAKFKYKAKHVNGKPVIADGQQYMFRFEIDK